MMKKNQFTIQAFTTWLIKGKQKLDSNTSKVPRCVVSVFIFSWSLRHSRNI